MIERAQPVAPVPEATMRPLDEWSSASPADLDPVARRLVAAVADEDLVEREQRLAVVELGLDHGAALDAASPASSAASSLRQPAGAMRTSTPS